MASVGKISARTHLQMSELKALRGEKGYLEMRIEKERNPKEKQKLEKRLKVVEDEIPKSSSKVSRHIAADSERNRAEKAAEARADEKAEETAELNLEYTENEDGDVVEISANAKKAAEANPAKIPRISVPRINQNGELIDVKV